MITAEFHCHTVYSHDSSNQIKDLVQAAKKKGINRLAITDHNTIQGALEAKAVAPDLIIVGEEILTSKGEIIGFYMKEEIPARLLPMETIERLKSQGAFIAIPHPCDRFRHGWDTDALKEILPHVDALETFNARSFSPRINDRAKGLGLEWDIPGIGGSDAHTSLELGLALTLLPDFNSPEELRESIHQAEIQGELLSLWNHFKTSFQIGWRELKEIRHKTKANGEFES